MYMALQARSDLQSSFFKAFMDPVQFALINTQFLTGHAAVSDAQAKWAYSTKCGTGSASICNRICLTTSAVQLLNPAAPPFQQHDKEVQA